MLKLPHFKTEAEEAEWWFTHQDEIADELELSRPKPGPGRALRRLAEIRGVTLEEIQATLRAHSSDPAELTSLPKRPRSA